MMTKKEYTSAAIYIHEFSCPMCGVPIGVGSATVIGAKPYESTGIVDENFEDIEDNKHSVW